MHYAPSALFPHGAPAPVKTKMSSKQADTSTQSQCFREKKQKHVELGDDKELETGNFIEKT